MVTPNKANAEALSPPRGMHPWQAGPGPDSRSSFPSTWELDFVPLPQRLL